LRRMAGDAKRKGLVDAAVRVRELDVEVVHGRGQCHVISVSWLGTTSPENTKSTKELDRARACSSTKRSFCFVSFGFSCLSWLPDAIGPRDAVGRPHIE